MTLKDPFSKETIKTLCFIRQKLSWSDARAECTRIGYKLLVIDVVVINIFGNFLLSINPNGLFLTGWLNGKVNNLGMWEIVDPTEPPKFLPQTKNAVGDCFAFEYYGFISYIISKCVETRSAWCEKV